MPSKPIILIIAHKEILSDYEKASLLQCYKVLGNHPARLICPMNLNTEIYRNLVPDIQFDYIEPSWQENYKMFNALKTSIFLYTRYKQFSHILFYELDAWVFKDELQYWCSQAFDYVGAPWFEGWNMPKSNKIIGVGNGGFSLRNNISSIRLLKRIILLQQLRKFWFKSRLQALWDFLDMIKLFKGLFHISSMQDVNIFFFEFPFQEDMFWAIKIPATFDDFIIAPVADACKFSFEVNPSYLFKINNNHLPFGCHAWEKYEPGFWSEFIDLNNHQVGINRFTLDGWRGVD